MSSASGVEKLSYGYSLLGALRKDLKTLQGFHTVVQELIQNAEDAKAETFWLDFTPMALRVGNSREFSEENFIRISEVASGSKRDDPETIGSFGVGFVSVYQITDEPSIYSRQEVRTLRPLVPETLRQAGVTHEWPTTIVLPWATEPSEVRTALETVPVDLNRVEEFIEQARRTFARSAVFLKHLKSLQLLRDGRLLDSLTVSIPTPSEKVLVDAAETVTAYRMHEVPVSDMLRQEAGRRNRRTVLQVALPTGDTPVRGLLYAFLPTQEETGLPLHINADFYPNTDRKTLLWDEEDKRGWNERLLREVVGYVPRLLADLAQQGHEALYTFLDRARIAVSDQPSPVAAFRRRFWEVCAQEVRRTPLLWANSGTFVKHTDFLHLPYGAGPLLRAALQQRTHWRLHSEEHRHYGALFKALGTSLLDAETFVKALQEMFGDDGSWAQKETRMDLLGEIFRYMLLLDQRQGGWTKQVANLAARLSTLALALTANGELIALERAWTCPDELLAVARPWLQDDVLVDHDWYLRAPSLFRELTNCFSPTELADHLKTTSVGELVDSGWPINEAYNALEGDRHLNGSLLKQLPIYPSTEGEYCAGGELAIPDRIKDPFHVRKLLDTEKMRSHFALLERINLDRLDLGTYYGRLLPEFFRNHLERRREVIEAIAEVSSRSDFPLDTWKLLPCAERTTGEWTSAETVYWPNALLTELFGEEYPEFASAHYRGRGVQPLMVSLGMQMSISPESVVRILKNREADPVTEEGIQLRQRILEHALATQGTALSEYLSKISWLPDKERTGWYRPCDLLRTEDAELVGSHLGSKRLCGCRISRKALPENKKAMKFARPELAQVIRHIGDLNSRNQGPSPKVLDWLNRRTEQLSEPLIRQLRELRLLQLTDNRFAAPIHLFRQNPKLGSWRHQAGAEAMQKYASLLDVLKVPELPTVGHFKDVLLEIARSRNSGSLLSKENQKVAENCFNQLANEYSRDPKTFNDIFAALQDQPIVPVYWKEDSAGSLVRANDALFLDMAERELERFGIPTKFDVRTKSGPREGFFKKLGVRTTSSVWRVIYRIPEDAQQPFPRQDQKLNDLLPALLRLCLKVKKNTAVNELRDQIGRFRFFRCGEIRAKAELVGYRLTGEATLSYGVDRYEGRIYIQDLAPRTTVKALSELLEIIDPSDVGVLSMLWKGGVKDALEFLDESGFPPLPEDYEPVQFTSAETADTVDTSGVEDEDGHPTVSEPVRRAAAEQGVGRPVPVEDCAQRHHLSHSVENSEISSVVARLEPTRSEARAPNSELRFHDSDLPRVPAERRSGPQQHTPAAFQKRLHTYTYVYDGPEEDEAQVHAAEVDRQGMKYVMEYEQARGRSPEDISHDYGAGYDIRSTNGDKERYIELKTISGPWGNRGVALSANQYGAARTYREKYWLYVIENLDTEPVLHEIQNPFERVTSYTFDGSWKDLDLLNAGDRT